MITPHQLYPILYPHETTILDENHYLWGFPVLPEAPGAFGSCRWPQTTPEAASIGDVAPKVLFLGWLEVLNHCIYIYIDLIVRIKAGASKKVDPPSQQCFPIKLKDCNPSITRDCPKVGKFRNTDGPFLNQWIWGFPPISSDHSHFHNNPH